MRSLLAILVLIVIAIVATFVIALIAHRVGLVRKSTFALCSNIATIVGVPLAVIAIIVAIAGLRPSGNIELANNHSNQPRPSPPVPSPTPPSPSPAPPSPAPPSPTPPLVDTTNQAQEGEPGDTTRTPSQDVPNPTPQTRYDRGDIGRSKDNGYYEMTLQNAKIEPSCRTGFVRVSDQEKLITITFSLRAAHLQVPSIPSGRDKDAYYIEDAEGRRYQMSCGDGRYFNVSLNSFEGKPKSVTLSVGFVVPITAQGLRFRFSPSAGDAMVLTLPSPL